MYSILRGDLLKTQIVFLILVNALSSLFQVQYSFPEMGTWEKTGTFNVIFNYLSYVNN